MTTYSSNFKVLCPFCNAPQSAKVIIELEYIDYGCETCGYGAGVNVTCEVKCCECDKVIYRKEGVKI